VVAEIFATPNLKTLALTEFFPNKEGVVEQDEVG
jgi:hypothetical protein